MTYLEENQAAGREIFPDLARAWALFGIALVNVGVLAWPMMSSYHHEGAAPASLDTAAWFGVNALFLMKSYSLFSFMFGVGFAYQMQSAERRGVGCVAAARRGELRGGGEHPHHLQSKESGAPL